MIYALYTVAGIASYFVAKFIVNLASPKYTVTKNGKSFTGTAEECMKHIKKDKED